MSDFARLAARGFGPALLPVIPPDAVLTPDTQVPLKARGKAPGLRGYDGRWYGYAKWRVEDATPEDHARWAAIGASVGMRCGWVIAADIDVRNRDVALLFDDVAKKRLGWAPLRIGQAPKRLRVYVAAPGETITKRKLTFTLPGDDTVQAVEVLGEGQQFVAAGIHPGTGQPYSWPEGEPFAFELTPVTAAQLDAFLDALASEVAAIGGTVLARTAGVEDRDSVDQGALLAPSPEALAEALAALPNTGDRDEWIRIGHAIKAAGGEAEQWGEWSDRWSPEDPGEIARRWEGFCPPFSTGWPQIERLARAAGWRDGAKHELGAALGADVLAGYVAEAKAAEEAKAAAGGGADGEGGTLQDAMFARYVWIEAMERIGDMRDKSLLTRTQFNARLAEIGPPHDSRLCAWAQFLQAKNGVVRARRVAGITYRPGGAAIVEESGRGKVGACFNTWRPSMLVPLEGATDDDVRPWLDLAARVLPDPRERGLLFDWLAALLQRPGVKPAFGVVFHGEHGVGKDSLILPVVRAVGQHNVQNIGVDDLQGAYTHWVASAQWVIVDEMHSFARREMTDRMKPILAAPPEMLQVNIKFLAQYSVPNIVACLMFTNHLDALSIEDGDRRLMCLSSPHPNIDRLPAAEADALAASFIAYHAWREAGGDAAVAGWLRARAIDGFLRFTRAPDTAAKAVMRREGRSETAAALDDALEGMDLPDLVAPSDLAARITASQGRAAGKAVSPHAVTRALRAMGAEQLGSDSVAVPQTALVTPAKRVRLWAIRNFETYRGVSPAALARAFGAMWGATKQDAETFFTPKEIPASQLAFLTGEKTGEGKTL